MRLGDVMTIKHGFAFPGSDFSEDPTLPTLVTPGNFMIGGDFRTRDRRPSRAMCPLNTCFDPETWW
jgi:hypothetical protein